MFKKEEIKQNIEYFGKNQIMQVVNSSQINILKPVTGIIAKDFGKDKYIPLDSYLNDVLGLDIDKFCEFILDSDLPETRRDQCIDRFNWYVKQKAIREGKKLEIKKMVLRMYK